MNRTILICVSGWAIALSSSLMAASTDPLGIPTNDPRPGLAANRNIFFNGVDVSSARNQEMRNVMIRIADNGDIFITAPQYQVTEEETYTPLSNYVPGDGRPEHKPMRERNKEGDLMSDEPEVAPVVNAAPDKGAPAGAPKAPGAPAPAKTANAAPDKPANAPEKK